MDRSGDAGRAVSSPVPPDARSMLRRMSAATWVLAIRLILGALAFCGAWLWLGDGERVLGPLVIVAAVMGLWALRRPTK